MRTGSKRGSHEWRPNGDIGNGCKKCEVTVCWLGLRTREELKKDLNLGSIGSANLR